MWGHFRTYRLVLKGYFPHQSALIFADFSYSSAPSFSFCKNVEIVLCFSCRECALLKTAFCDLLKLLSGMLAGCFEKFLLFSFASNERHLQHFFQSHSCKNPWCRYQMALILMNKNFFFPSSRLKRNLQWFAFIPSSMNLKLPMGLSGNIFNRCCLVSDILKC